MKKADKVAKSVWFGIEPELGAKFVVMLPEVATSGFITRESLAKKFGETVTTQFLAIFFRSLRMLREAARPVDGSTVKGYEWADSRFSGSQIKDLPEWLAPVRHLFQPPATRYTGYTQVTLKCRYTNKVLAGMIDPTDHDKRVFDQDPITKEILIPAYCVRSMFKDAIPLILDNKPQSLAYRIMFAAVRIKGVKPEVEFFPVAPEYKGGDGRGKTATEVLPAGTLFEIDAMIPSSELSVEQYTRIIQMGGRYVRLSPGRSAGRGDFEVLS